MPHVFIHYNIKYIFFQLFLFTIYFLYDKIQEINRLMEISMNIDSRVVLKRCEKYDCDEIYNIIKESINTLKPISSFINKDTKVFIKLNCVGGYTPESGITTHPVFVRSVVKLIKEYTDNIIIGDNPASKDIHSVLKKNGVMDIVNEYNLKIIDGSKQIKITSNNYKIYSTFNVSSDILDSDVIINLPKLKTHTLTYMSCAQKNLFGVIFGLEKASWHAKASNPLQFGEALNDLYSAILNYHPTPILHICDGILGLDGEGPTTGGKSKKANAILTSFDAISLDRVALELLKLNKERYFLSRIALSRGLTNEKYSLIGSLDEFKDVKFDGPKNEITSFGLRLIRKRVFRNLLLEHPKVNKDKCIRCGECSKICPPQTMKIEKGKYPHLTSRDCIRCWCCQEVCPQNAIYKTKRPLIGKIVFKIKL